MSSSMKTISAIVLLALIAGGAYFWTQQNSGGSNAPSTSLTIQFGNNSYDALNSVEVSPAGADTFQALPLADGKLGAGEFIEYAIADGQTTCTFDLRATKESGASVTNKGVTLCGTTFYHFEDVGYE